MCRTVHRGAILVLSQKFKWLKTSVTVLVFLHIPVCSRNVTLFYTSCCLLSFWTVCNCQWVVIQNDTWQQMSNYFSVWNENVLRECNITLKDCRLCTLKTIPSVASHLPEFYFWCSKKVHVPTNFTLSLSCAHICQGGKKYLRWAAEKCSYAVHEGVLSVQIQHSISITDSVVIDSEFALCSVWARHNRS